MDFQIDDEDNYNNIIINVLIIEDSYEQAKSIKDSVEKYNSIFNGKRDIFGNALLIKFEAVVNGGVVFDEHSFNGKLAYVDSFNFLMEKKIKVDIILCDFDLGNIKGNLALEKITEAEKINTIRWYKVLHSIGSEYQEFQNDKIVDFTFDSKNRDAIHNVILKTFENKILTPILYGNPIQFENYYTGSNEINFKRMNKEMYNDILFERILCVHSTQFSENYKIIYLGEDYSIQESTTYVALSNLKMLYFHKVDKSLYINKLWIADYNIQKNCVKFIRNGNQQFVININEVLKKKKHVPNILSYFNSLLSSQKPEIFVEPKSLQRYFHFS